MYGAVVEVLFVYGQILVALEDVESSCELFFGRSPVEFHPALEFLSLHRGAPDESIGLRGEGEDIDAGLTQPVTALHLSVLS